MIETVCCFFGHRKIDVTEDLTTKLSGVIENLILNENIDTFLFGSKSEFDSLCLELTTKLKEKYPYIKRIYVRTTYPHISENYRDYLLELYDDTYYPEKIIHSGRASYLERNFEMIDKSRICVTYYNPNYALTPIIKRHTVNAQQRKSGTRLAYEYALKNNKIVINMFE